MKKISIFVMAVILVSSLIPGIYADDTTDADAKTQVEVECMGNHTGAAIRLLQLEKAITKNILKGDAVVDVLSTMEYNTIDLEATLIEFELLLAEVQAADPIASDAVQVFVDLKSDAIELSKEFRETVPLIVDEGTKDMLREHIGEMTSDQVQNLSTMIKNQIRRYNGNLLYRLKGFLGETNESVFDEYERGNMTWAQVKAQVRLLAKNMTQEHRNELFGELKESRIRSRIHSYMNLDNASDGFQTRKEARLTLRLHLGQNLTEGYLRAAFEQRIMNRMHQNTDNGGSGSGNGNGTGGSGDGNGTGGSGSGGSGSGNSSGNTNSSSDDTSGNGYSGSQGPGGDDQP